MIRHYQCKNWRFDCGVAGLDNRVGLPPYFPTRLRFEDYIYRLWLNHGNVVSAHTDCVQHHLKSNYMRNPLASEIFNEEISGFLKKKIKESVSSVRSRIEAMKDQTPDGQRKDTLTAFLISLEKSFYGYDEDFFEQNVNRILDDVISQIKGGLELWQNLIEIVFLMKMRGELPVHRLR